MARDDDLRPPSTMFQTCKKRNSIALTTILVLQPDQTDPPERVGEWLRHEGIALRMIRPFDGEAVPTTVVEDGVIVLGGDMGAHDDRDHPWLSDIKVLLHRAVAFQVPTLGICLGAQLLAAATGGQVERGADGMESGVAVIAPRPEAKGDELFGSLPERMRMMTMHRDAITALPPGALWLADSDPYPHQAFRLGSSAWGVQFHPEISPATYRTWARFSTDEGEGLQRVIDGIPEVERFDGAILPAAEAFTRSFADIVRRRSRSHR